MRVDPIQYGASFSSSALLAANTAQAIFTPASNVRGAIVHRAYAQSNNAGSGANFSLLAKSSAPANTIDGDVICMGTAISYVAGNVFIDLTLQDDVFIPPGKGLYFISQVAEGAAPFTQRGALYTLL